MLRMITILAAVLALLFPVGKDLLSAWHMQNISESQTVTAPDAPGETPDYPDVPDCCGDQAIDQT